MKLLTSLKVDSAAATLRLFFRFIFEWGTVKRNVEYVALTDVVVLHDLPERSTNLTDKRKSKNARTPSRRKGIDEMQQP